MNKPGRLEITTMIGCSINCVYCPQKLLLDRYFEIDKNRKSKLDLDDFIKCLDALPPETRIDFSGMAEPWLNEQCTDMVCYAAERGFAVAIYTTLVGMNKADFDRIKDISFEEFVLHIPDDKSNAHIHVTKEYLELLSNVMNYNRDGTPIVTAYSCHAGIHPAIKNAISENATLITELINRAGNITDEYVKSKANIGEIICINCDNDLNHNVLLPDGTVLLCCMDYGMRHILGNLFECDYSDIINSSEATSVRIGMKDENINILCRNCTNARNIHEIFEEYKMSNDWCNGLLKNETEKDLHLRKYREWIENYKKRDEDLENYKQWVKKYQNLEQELKGELRQITEQYEMRIKELTDYKDWVNNYAILEKQLRAELAEAKSTKI